MASDIRNGRDTQSRRGGAVSANVHEVLYKGARRWAKTMSKEIVEISYLDVKPFYSRAKKEHVRIRQKNNVRWLGIHEDSRLVSFCSLQKVGKTMRFGSNYTIPKYRGHGNLAAFIDYAKTFCMDNGIHKMTAFCTESSISQHIRHGAKVVSENHGVFFLEYTI